MRTPTSLSIAAAFAKVLKTATVHVQTRKCDVGLADTVRRVAMRDEVAAAELYDATCHLVFGLASRMLDDPTAAEDIVIEVYTQAFSTASSFDPNRGSAEAWILTLTRSRAIDALRARGREPVTETIDMVQQRQSERPSPEEVSLAAERRRFVSGALSRLSPEQREAIELAYFAGLSHSDIATRLGRPLGTIKTRIRQGMIQLREFLGPHATGTEKGFS